MSAGLSIERLRREGEAFMEEISREYYLAHAGLKPSAELQPMYAKHREILGRDALELTREAFRDARRRAARSGARRGCCSTGRRSRRARASSRRWTSARSRGRATRSCGWPTGARSRTSARRSRWRTRRDRDERAWIEAARARSCEGARADAARAVSARARHHRVARARATATTRRGSCSTASRSPALRDECAQFLRDTQAMWDEVCPRVREARDSA